VRYPLNEYRACWKQAGQPLGQRETDLKPVWGRLGLGSIIPWGIAQGLAGYAFTCPDMIGGGLAGDFEGSDYTLDQEMIVRWTQASALFPMMQFSLAPWRVLDAVHLAHVQDAVRIREELTPYILELVRHAAATGEPILRSLEYSYPGVGLAKVTDQFMLGDDVLVAPVLTPGARGRVVTFPPGTWTDQAGSEVHGPLTQEMPVPLGTLPFWRRIVTDPVRPPIG
jgi:alpha-glucosidase (family GH31 glycosyl hydrolase)